MIRQTDPNTLTILAHTASLNEALEHEVKVSFFGALSFGRFADPDVTDDGVAQTASLQDLLATKLKALLQRLQAKGYLDVAALLGAGSDLDYGLAGARALYCPAFQPAECLKALVYFQGGDLETLSADTRNTLIRAVAGSGPLPEVAVVSYALTLTPSDDGGA